MFAKLKSLGFVALSKGCQRAALPKSLLYGGGTLSFFFNLVDPKTQPVPAIIKPWCLGSLRPPPPSVATTCTSVLFLAGLQPLQVLRFFYCPYCGGDISSGKSGRQAVGRFPLWSPAPGVSLSETPNPQIILTRWCAASTATCHCVCMWMGERGASIG